MHSMYWRAFGSTWILNAKNAKDRKVPQSDVRLTFAFSLRTQRSLRLNSQHDIKNSTELCQVLHFPNSNIYSPFAGTVIAFLRSSVFDVITSLPAVKFCM